MTSKVITPDVETRTIDWDTLIERVRGGQEAPYAVYEFGNGRKQFMDTHNPPAIFDKPVVHNPDGSVTHTADPDFNSTNTPQPLTRTIGL